MDYLNSEKIKYAWVNISENIFHIFSYLQIIVSVLQKLNPSFGKNTLQILDASFEKNKFKNNEKDAVNDIILTLKEECKNHFHEKIALILDDYHHIEEHSWKDYVTDLLVKNLPDNIQMIITSRQLPEMDLTHYALNKQLSKIEMEDLIFNDEEVKAVLSAKYNGFTAPEDKIKSFTQKLGGWITGLHLIMQGYRDNPENLEIEEQPIPENIFNSLADKILVNMDSEIQEFLLITSLIDNFDSELCEKFLNINNFEKIIAKLISNYTFVQTIPIIYNNGEQVISYNYQNLFRNYLNSQLRSKKPEKDIKDISENTYKYYLSKDDIVTAIKYMLQAEDYGIAIESISSNFNDIFNMGKIEFLWQWMNEIGKERFGNNPESLINYGILLKFYKGDLHTALGYFQQAINTLKGTPGYNILSRAYINKAGILQNLGKTSEVIKDLESLVKDNNYSDFSEIIEYNLAYAFFHLSEYEKSENLLNGILKNAKSEKDIDILTKASRLSGHINLVRGNYIKAVQYYEKSVVNEKNIIEKFEVLCNLSLLSSQTAEYSKAGEYMRALDDLIQKFPTPVFKIPYLLAKQAFYYESGLFDDALKVLYEINDFAKSLNHKQYLYLSSRLITECLYYKGEKDNARKYYEISKEFADKDNILKKTEFEVTGALIMDKNFREKEKILLNACKYYKDNSLLNSLSQVCYFLAGIYFKNNALTEAYQYSYECIKLCEINGYASFLIREYRFDKTLFENLTKKITVSTYIKEIKEKALKM